MFFFSTLISRVEICWTVYNVLIRVINYTKDYIDFIVCKINLPQFTTTQLKTQMLVMDFMCLTPTVNWC